MIRQRILLGQRWPDMPDVLQVARTMGCEVAAAVEQAQPSVRSATYLGGVVIVLAVVLPEADRADLELPALIKGEVTAARAGVRTVFRPTVHVGEASSVA